MTKELVVVATLRNWRKQVCSEDNDYVIWGDVYDDVLNRFHNGQFIHTSRIQKEENGFAYTQNHIYRLEGDPVGPPFGVNCFNIGN